MTYYTTKQSDFEGLHLIAPDGKIVATLSVVTPEALALMLAGPGLLVACKAALAGLEAGMELDDPQARTQIEWEGEPMATLRTAIGDAEPMSEADLPY